MKMGGCVHSIPQTILMPEAKWQAAPAVPFFHILAIITTCWGTEYACEQLNRNTVFLWEKAKPEIFCTCNRSHCSSTASPPDQSLWKKISSQFNQKILTLNPADIFFFWSWQRVLSGHIPPQSWETFLPPESSSFEMKQNNILSAFVIWPNTQL